MTGHPRGRSSVTKWAWFVKMGALSQRALNGVVFFSVKRCRCFYRYAVESAVLFPIYWCRSDLDLEDYEFVCVCVCTNVCFAPSVCMWEWERERLLCRPTGTASKNVQTDPAPYAKQAAYNTHGIYSSHTHSRSTLDHTEQNTLGQRRLAWQDFPLDRDASRSLNPQWPWHRRVHKEHFP